MMNPCSLTPPPYCHSCLIFDFSHFSKNVQDRAIPKFPYISKTVSWSNFAFYVDFSFLLSPKETSFNKSWECRFFAQSATIPLFLNFLIFAIPSSSNFVILVWNGEFWHFFEDCLESKIEWKGTKLTQKGENWNISIRDMTIWWSLKMWPSSA
jgi:hypothetical protein